MPLLSQLTVTDAEEYLVARKAHGFTAIQAMLAMAPETRNREGQAPFQRENDFARPNEKYFAHVDSVLAAAMSVNNVENRHLMKWDQVVCTVNRFTFRLSGGPAHANVSTMAARTVCSI
ncbi:MAG: DUF4038 domain-containing protein [Candidatus Solibacter sp.]|nr:DUF4038 domain-containing protein [Candidatus Solibacter sp.]